MPKFVAFGDLLFRLCFAPKRRGWGLKSRHEILPFELEADSVITQTMLCKLCSITCVKRRGRKKGWDRKSNGERESSFALVCSWLRFSLLVLTITKFFLHPSLFPPCLVILSRSTSGPFDQIPGGLPTCNEGRHPGAEREWDRWDLKQWVRERQSLGSPKSFFSFTTHYPSSPTNQGHQRGNHYYSNWL